ncbi:MAG: Arc family DNA-binding protein [Steroidobacteraceae bacterium]
MTVRNIPRSVLERLRARAIRHRRSMQGEILAILETVAATDRPELSVSQLLARVRSRGVATPAESAEMIRADRDGR